MNTRHFLAPEGPDVPRRSRRPKPADGPGKARQKAETASWAAENRQVGGFAAAAGKQMEPNRVSIRLFGDVLVMTPK
ncbi:hypothetical protein [Streptomyces beigongshangae]|uniref:hypothetical protein n=1 Tax=Streptomyces beigongshangae TaxID=2841597 RepID=UPI001C865582|nr:hypothetical protein [Streptomyces sp. REN17]